MAEIVAWVDLEGLVVVGHSASEVVLVVACESAVDIVAGYARALEYGFVNLAFGLCVVATIEAYHRPHGPRLGIVGIDDEGGVHERERTYGVGLLHGHLGLHGEVLGIARPVANHLVEG